MTVGLAIRQAMDAKYPRIMMTVNNIHNFHAYFA